MLTGPVTIRAWSFVRDDVTLEQSADLKAAGIGIIQVDPGTQIHTHLCCSEFGEISEAINALDADVTSIEAARSRMEVLNDISVFGRVAH